jgi:hypothetical protein
VAVHSCEAFIDRAVKVTSPSNVDVLLYVKVDPALLDGSPRSVVLFAKGFFLEETKFVNTLARVVDGATDEYVVSIPISGKNADFGERSQTTTGAVYVETDRGTRYWINPAGGGNFTWDQNFADRLSDSVSAASSPPPPPLPSTLLQTGRLDADGSSVYANPDRCKY